MGVKRCCMHWLNLEILVGLLLLISLSISEAYTNPGDVVAINNLYVALGSPTLPGWVATGGDPCGEAWQGVQCDNVNKIISIKLVGANLGGELGNNLENFFSIKTIELKNNHIGGGIPSNLPSTLENLFLSSNEFTGSIPSSLSSLNQLIAMSLDFNRLSGEIPDAFQELPKFKNLDLSNNNLSGKLPPSLNSSSLATIHVQNNQLSGTLDVLQHLENLEELNVENNQFSGIIPEKLTSIRIFKKDGNLFDTTIAPLPPPPSSTTSPRAPPFFGVPTPVQAPPASSGRTPGKQAPSASVQQADGPSTTKESNSNSTKKSSRTKRIVLISIGSFMLAIILLLVILLFMPRCFRRTQVTNQVSRRFEIAPYTLDRENPPRDEAPNISVVRPKEEHQPGPRRLGSIPKPRNDVQKLSAIPKSEDREIDISRFDVNFMPPPPPPPPPPRPPPSAEVTAMKSSAKPLPSIYLKSYSIASLQHFTNSFSQENLLGGGMLGSVYRAELPHGKLLAVKKLDKRVSDQQTDDEFLGLVNNIDKIRHANVVEIMGYCAEHGHRLLIYEYCSNGTLHDALHSDDVFKNNLSWNSRIRMALGAARALVYLHEVCEPPIMHRNFKSANILLDDELDVHVSDCGLAPLISSGAVSKLSGQLLTTYGYGAPEFEYGIYSSKSDVYSFGVVMLELLTGRTSYDRTRIRGEQFLVRWAIPQLHDIDALSRMVDPALNGKYSVKSLSRFADIISRCVQQEPEFRPPMSEVVQDLIQMIRRESPKRSH